MVFGISIGLMGRLFFACESFGVCGVNSGIFEGGVDLFSLKNL
jgi:hypothetical protein